VVAQDLFGDGPATPLMRPRQVIELATLNGARVLGLDAITGSLKPGKRADVIVVRTDALNMLPASQTNPTFQVVQSAQPVNVDTVIADGRVLKRHGQIVGVDVAAVIARAAAAQEAIRERAGFPVPDLME
jgi:5-methylthioadenosine/S-adenosylhomocysteine deaminase